MTSTETATPVVVNITTRSQIVSDADLDRLDAIAKGSTPAARYARMGAGMLREEVVGRGRPAAETIMESHKKAAEVDAALTDPETEDELVQTSQKISAAYDALVAKREAAVKAAADAAAEEWDVKNGERVASGKVKRDEALAAARKSLSGNLVDDSVLQTYKDVLDFVSSTVKEINKRLPETEAPIVVQGGAKVGGKAVAKGTAGDGWRPKLAIATVDGVDAGIERDGKVARTFTLLARAGKVQNAKALQDMFINAAGSREAFDTGTKAYTVEAGGKVFVAQRLVSNDSDSE